MFKRSLRPHAEALLHHRSGLLLHSHHHLRWPLTPSITMTSHAGAYDQVASVQPELKEDAPNSEPNVAGDATLQGSPHCRFLGRIFGKPSSTAAATASPPPAPFTHADDAPEHVFEYNHTKSWFSTLRSWYSPASSAEARRAENALLSRIPYFSTAGAGPGGGDAPAANHHVPPGHAVTARVGYVDIAEKGSPPMLIHTMALHDAQAIDLAAPPDVGVVLAHGYGAGVGVWYSSLHGLAEGLTHRGLPIYAFDWLGMARSARVPFPLTEVKVPCAGKEISPEDQRKLDKELEVAYDKRAIVAEQYFVDALERWRETVGLRRMILVGHSLGGYLSSVYATKHPDRIERLVLVSPAGVPVTPPEVLSGAVTNKTTKGQQSEVRKAAPISPGSNDIDERPPEAVALETTGEEAQEAIVDAQDGSPQDSSSVNSDPPSEAPSSPPSQPPQRPPPWLMRTLRYLWGAGYTPFSMARAVGPLGPRLFSWYSARRFSHLGADEIAHLRDYLFHINTAGRPAGEYALAALLRPGAWAFRPLVDQLPPWLRLRAAAAQAQGQGGECAAATKPKGADIVFLYGDRDWMGYHHAFVVRDSAPRPEQVVVRRVPGAGHQVFMDHPENFVRLAVPAILGEPIPELVLDDSV